MRRPVLAAQNRTLDDADSRAAEPGQIVDLMAALNESVQQARASRGEDADVHELPKKKAAKKQPAKKATAKKTTKAATKKTSGRQPRSA